MKKPTTDDRALLDRAEDEADHQLIEASKKRNAAKTLIRHASVMREFGLTPARKRRKS